MAKTLLEYEELRTSYNLYRRNNSIIETLNMVVVVKDRNLLDDAPYFFFSRVEESSFFLLGSL